MVLLFSQPLHRTFKAPLCSLSTLFCFFLFLVSIILPFFISFSTPNFWLTRETYFEQPKVLYRKEFFIQTTSITSSISTSFLQLLPSTSFYSTLGPLNDLNYESLSPIQLKSSVLDTNFDGFPEQHNFNITLFTASDEIRNIKIVSFYDYQIRQRIKADLVGMAYVEIDTPYGAGSVLIDGTLKFKQNRPLKPSSLVRNDYNTSELSQTSGLQNFIPTLLLQDKDRNYTTNFKYTVLSTPKGQDYTTVSLRVRIPTSEQYEYEPQFLEVMKFAWIQYQSILIPVGLALFVLASFIFTNQILEARIDTESKKNVN